MIKSLQNLDLLIEEIQESANKGKWFLKTEKCSSILNIKIEEFYKKAYLTKKNKKKEFHADYKKGFHYFEVEDLIFLLSDTNWKVQTIKDIFIVSGIYLNEEFLNLFKTFSLKQFSDFFTKYKIDKELLNLYISSTKKFDDAFESYLEYIDFISIIHQTVSYFLKAYNISTKSGIDFFLKKSLNKSLEQKNEDFWFLIKPFKDRCYKEFFKAKTKINSKKLALLKFFDLNEKSSKKDLKIKFNQMIKKHHPDLNKNGEEMTKLILEKYKVLVKIWDK